MGFSTHSVKYVVIVSIYTSFMLIAVVFHREPLSSDKLIICYEAKQAYMIFWKILLPRTQKTGLLCLISKDKAVFWEYKLSNLEFCVGDDATRYPRVGGAVHASVQDILAPMIDASTRGAS